LTRTTDSTGSTRPIVVIGSANVDLVVRCARLPAAGETVHGHSFATLPGGKGAHQAVAAARLGAAVRFVGCVGDDAFGAIAHAALAAEGIDLTGLRRVSGTPTGVALIAVDDAGRNTITLAAGANACVGVADVDAAPIAGAALVVCQLEVPVEVVAHAAARARGAGVPFLLNPAPASALPPTLLAQVDLLVPNETEAALLGGDASALRALGPRTVIVTLGERGVAVATAEGGWAEPAPRAHAVDTTGAGDAFVGALAAALVEGQPLRAAVGFAQRAAAISVTRPGAMAALARRDELG
jgi:ribokinase